LKILIANRFSGEGQIPAFHFKGDLEVVIANP